MLFSQAVTCSWTPYFHDAYAPGNPGRCLSWVLRSTLMNVARNAHCSKASRIKTLVLIAIACSLLSGCSASIPHRTGPIVKNDYQFLGEYMDWMITREAKKAHVNAVTVAVVDDQRVVWSKGYGWADTTKQVPATPETLFRVGSISKLFTATEIMRRVERGEIELDSDISQQLPGFSIHSRFANAKPITVRSLLSHHSGLPSNRWNEMFTNKPVDLATLEKQIAEDSLIAAPQTKFNYSNLGFSLLGRIIEVRSNETFAAAMKENILDPLGMAHSTFAPVAVDSKGYNQGKELPPVEMPDRPAGSLVASAHDLARFVEFVLADGRAANGQQLIRSETLRSMFQPQFPGLPLDFGHRTGLCWGIEGMRVQGAGPIVGHGGGLPGYSAHLSVAPETKLGVVVLANDQAAGGFLGQVGKKAIALALEAKLGVAEQPEKPEPSKPKLQPIELPKETLDGYVDDYIVMGQLTHVARSGDHLSADAFGKHFNLLPIAANKFVPEVSVLLGLWHKQLSNFSVTVSDVEGRRFAVLSGPFQTMAFERFTRRPLPASWARRLGQCRVEPNEGDFKFGPMRLEFVDGILALDLPVTSVAFGISDMPMRLLLDPIDDTNAATVNFDGSVVRVIGDPGHEKFFLSGFTFTCRRASDSPRTN